MAAMFAILIAGMAAGLPATWRMKMTPELIDAIFEGLILILCLLVAINIIRNQPQ